MPTVPGQQAAPTVPGQPQGSKPSPTDFAMAAATMHQMGRLFEPMPESTNVVDRRSEKPETETQTRQNIEHQINMFELHQKDVEMHGRLAKAGVKFNGLSGDAGYNDIKIKK